MPTIRRYSDLSCFQGILRGGDNYVEIGAHHARFLTCSGLLNPTNVYDLYEPSPAACRYLRQKFADMRHVHVHQEAVANSRGVLAFFVNDELNLGVGNTICAEVLLGARPISVKTVTLGDVFASCGIDRIRLLAINAEQAEYKILMDPDKLLDRVDYITCEFHPSKSGIDTHGYLAAYLRQFETLTLMRQGEQYNIWFGRNRSCTD